jgi:hypothetical protein
LICPRLASADNPFIGMQRRGGSRQKIQDLAQSALRVGIELAGRCNGFLEQVGESATRRGIRGQQPRQRLNCSAFVDGQDRPLLAQSSLEISL